MSMNAPDIQPLIDKLNEYAEPGFQALVRAEGASLLVNAVTATVLLLSFALVGVLCVRKTLALWDNQKCDLPDTPQSYLVFGGALICGVGVFGCFIAATTCVPAYISYCMEPAGYVLRGFLP